jgi:O-antigen ligase
VVAVVLGILVRWAATGIRPAGGGRALLLTGAYVLVAASTLFVAEDPDGARFALESLVKDVTVAVLIGLLLHRGTSLRRVVWVLIAGGAVMGALSMIQIATASYDSVFFGFAQASVENIVGTTDDIRISGPIGDANFYAQILVMLLPLALDRMWRDPLRLGRIAGAITSALLTATIVMTFSRGGALGLVVVGALMLATHPPKATTLLALVVVVAAAVPLIPDSYMARLGTVTQVGSVEGDTDVSIRYRTAELTAGLGMITDHPLTGVGYANYPDAYPEYSRRLGIDFRNTERKPHNLAVEVAAETGIPGLAAFGIMLFGAGGALLGSRRRLLEAGRTDTAALALAIGVGLVGHLVTSLFLHLDFARLFWTFVGLALAMPNVADHETAQEPAR